MIQQDQEENGEDWQQWLKVWRKDMPTEEPATDQDSEPPRRSKKGGVITLGAVAALGVVIAGTFIFVKSVVAPAPEISAEGTTHEVAATEDTTTTEPAPATTTTPALACEEFSGDGKLVTSHGGQVTSPETLVAEFQHRYFDLRDGKAVAELWDTGYDGDGFQSTIDTSLADAPAEVQWCLTVMPAETGWWATEVSWWEPGATTPEQTWYGNYRIEQRGSGWIFTDSAAGEKA